MIGMSICCAILGAPWIVIRRVPTTWEDILGVFVFCVVLDIIRGIAGNMAAENRCVEHYIKTKEIKCSIEFSFMSLSTYIAVIGAIAVPYILFGGHFFGRPYSAFSLLRFILYLTIADCVYQYAKNMHIQRNFSLKELVKYNKISGDKDYAIIKKKGLFHR